MNVKELREQMTDALKAHDQVRLNIVRQVLGEVQNLKVEEKREPNDADVTAMIKRTIKQTNETLESSIKANNNQQRTDDLARQVKILQDMLPEQLTGDALNDLVQRTIADLGATSKKDMGKIMGALSKATDGNFDKAAAAKMAQEILK